MPFVFAGKYELIRRLGTGGMAEVFLARQLGDADFEKIVALKKILPHLVTQRQNIDMFIDEARIAAQFDHRNIIRIYDFGIHEETPYIVMEYVHGVSLNELLRKCAKEGALPPLEIALYIFRSACCGLDYVHRKAAPNGTPLNIVHRDLDPQNIFLSFDGEVKIADFGIARTDIQHHQTAPGTLKGKINYMSPEAIAGEPVDQRSDIFSMGVVFYKIVAGRTPFHDTDMRQVLARVHKWQYLPVRQAAPLLPVEIAEIIDKALAREPERRYASVEDLLVSIDKVIERQAKRSESRTLGKYLCKHFPSEAAAPNLPQPGEQVSIDPAIRQIGVDLGLDASGKKEAHRGLKTGWSVTEIPSVYKRRKRLLSLLAVVAVVGLIAAFVSWKSNSDSQYAPPASPVPAADAYSEEKALTQKTEMDVTVQEKQDSTVSKPAVPDHAPFSASKALEPKMPMPPQVSTGSISVNSDVGCEVFLDGKPIGATPISSFQADAGHHVVLLQSASLGLSQSIYVKIEPKKTWKVSANFLAILMVDAKPWAEVY